MKTYEEVLEKLTTRGFRPANLLATLALTLG